MIKKTKDPLSTQGRRIKKILRGTTLVNQFSELGSLWDAVTGCPVLTDGFINTISLAGDWRVRTSNGVLRPP
ncbi:hypothetical protein ACFLXB_04490 [Chloroflexota bacterium]